MISDGQTRRKTTRFRELLASPGLEFLMEAHNGLSARIVEETGFNGVWASGLCISAAMGVRDNNEASWTQVLDVLEFMSDATSIPILLDADTGYGNFNNVRRLVRKLEQRNIAAMCIEDKLFPKTNSFIEGERQPLADPAEFCGKIRAAKDTQDDRDFCVVARVEALITGHGQAEAMRRAEAYSEAGADAVLIHSKRSTAEEILAFMEAWDGACPVIIVPTTYYTTPVDVFADAGVSIVIWANHLLRSSVAAMQRVAATLYKERAIEAIEQHVVSVQEVFRLQRADELERAELRYLPGAGDSRH
jgi:phosphoenolpyruvate phosphomutase